VKHPGDWSTQSGIRDKFPPKTYWWVWLVFVVILLALALWVEQCETEPVTLGKVIQLGDRCR
jgi:hypothetical protein